MIEKIIQWSRTTEVNDAAIRLYTAFDNSGPDDPYLASTFTTLNAENLKLTQVIRRTKAESELEAKDELRDDKVRALYYLLKGFLHHPTPEIRLTAQALMDIFNKYGLAITGESYATESSLIFSLLLDLAAPEYQEAIAALSGCAELITQLNNAQGDFEEARLAYETEKAKEGMVENASTVKKQVVSIINDKIVVYLRAMIEVNPDSYTAFAAICTQIIADNNEQVKKRRQKPEAPQPEEVS